MIISQLGDDVPSSPTEEKHAKKDLVELFHYVILHLEVLAELRNIRVQTSPYRTLASRAFTSS